MLEWRRREGGRRDQLRITRFAGIIICVMVLCVSLLITFCAKPKIIPNERLAQIFHDIYLVNAYNDTEKIVRLTGTGTGNWLDSLNIYEPIFAKYGYTSEDIQFTIGSFSKRKSARLAEDIVARAEEMLRAESDVYNHRLAIIDTLGRRARELFRREVYYNPRIEVRRIADTGRLQIALPVEAGSYRVSFSYLVDTTDANGNLRTNIYLEDADGRVWNNNSRRLTIGERQRMVVDIDADTTRKRLVLDLNPYSARDIQTPMALTLDSIEVIHYLPEELARDSMARQTLYEKPLFEPHIDTLRVAER